MAQLKGFEKLTTIDEALRIFFEKLQLKRLGEVQIAVYEALGRVVAEDVTAGRDLPHFNRSAMDGYAVKAKNTFDASQFQPKTLQLTGGETVHEGEAKLVWTGTPLPEGADAVVMLEYTKKLGDEIEVWKPVTPWTNVSKRGEDVQKGEIAVEAGTQLCFHHLGLLAALGVTTVQVVKNPQVAVLSTGNELVDLGCQLGENQVIEVNRLILSSMCQQLGAQLIDLGIAKDNLKEIAMKIQEGLEKADVVITTGGTSVGKADLVPAAVNQIGSPGVVVHGIAMRPAMPTALAVLRDKPVLLLSGNPVAAMIGFDVFARPLIFKLLGTRCKPRPTLKAKLTRKVASVLGRRVFLRVHVSEKNGEFFAQPVRVKGSGILSTMTKANGYVMAPEDREGLKKGELVTVHLFST
ncbi:MAG: gephyrin-like molybdotransferase Glp [Thermoproteota archaeon]|nr:gephyrin-like molybdotransferase Glp [Thermoproteota archaeon]